MSTRTVLNSVNINIKKAIRIISFKKRDEPSSPLFKEHNVLPFDKSIKLKQAKFMWKLNYGYLPPSLSNNFKLHSTTLRSRYSTPTKK